MDLDTIAEYLPLYTEATILTVRIALMGIIGSFIVGLICAVISYNRIPVLSHLIAGYIELSRNTPLLVQLFLIYFGLPRLGIVLSGEVSAIIGLTFLGGSYMAEALRAGLASVETIQWESAQSLGLGPFHTLRYVALPQALAVSIPPLAANIIFLIKETSVVSVVAVPDLVNVARDLIGIEYNTLEALVLLVAAYLVILLPISIGARLVERRLRHAGFGD
ncbi:MAG: amino acid ABC transporter permease [Actinomycetaceae bacterium]|nr:amino acid ABC transporter permease [Actinomycetaceae bacterium]